MFAAAAAGHTKCFPSVFTSDMGVCVCGCARVARECASFSEFPVNRLLAFCFLLVLNFPLDFLFTLDGQRLPSVCEGVCVPIVLYMGMCVGHRV